MALFSRLKSILTTYFQVKLLLTCPKWYWLRIFSHFKRNVDSYNLEHVGCLLTCLTDLFFLILKSMSHWLLCARLVLRACPLQLAMMCYVCHSYTSQFRAFAASLCYLSERTIYKAINRVCSQLLCGVSFLPVGQEQLLESNKQIYRTIFERRNSSGQL